MGTAITQDLPLDHKGDEPPAASVSRVVANVDDLGLMAVEETALVWGFLEAVVGGHQPSSDVS